MSNQDKPLLDVRDLTVAFGAGESESQPVRSVSLSLGRSEVLGVVGESGSGKTMISKSIMRLLPSGGRIASGSVWLDGTDLTTLDAESIRRVRGARIGMIFQEPMMSLNPAMRIGEQMVEAFVADRRLTPAQRQTAMLEMLERVRMPDPDACLRAYPHEFSGGMRQRIMLATALLMRPELLIADEPTTALDVLIQKDVLDLMIELVRDLGTSVMLISHDLGLVARYADRVCVMCDGKVVETGDVATILSSPSEQYTKELLQSLPARDRGRQSTDEIDTNKPVMKVIDLHVEFGRRRLLPWLKSRIVRAVDGVDFSLRRGETLAVVGESGSGKTTLGRALLRLVETTAGSVEFDGDEISSRSARQLRNLRSRMQIVYQDPFSSLDPRMRVEQIVAEGLRLSSLTGADRANRVRETLHDVGLSPEMARRYPHELSGGQRQRVSIARAIAMRPDVIVTDEAVSALDVTVQARVLTLLQTLQERYGFSYLFITHDIGVVDQVADRVLVMYRGRVVESGNKAEVLDTPRHPYTCRLLEAVPRLEKTTDGGFRHSNMRFDPPPPPDGYLHDENFLDINANAGVLVHVTETHQVAYTEAGERAASLG